MIKLPTSSSRPFCWKFSALRVSYLGTETQRRRCHFNALSWFGNDSAAPKRPGSSLGYLRHNHEDTSREGQLEDFPHHRGDLVVFNGESKDVGLLTVVVAAPGGPRRGNYVARHHLWPDQRSLIAGRDGAVPGGTKIYKTHMCSLIRLIIANFFVLGLTRRALRHRGRREQQWPR